jgi:dienelactone hydrolase
MPEEVTYLSQGIKIAAKLYFLQDSSEKKCAVIVASHPGGGCKEQTAAIYAERLAQLGFITLTFNAAYQGAKGDEPYYLEDPSQRAEDIKDTVTYLSTLTQVEPERVGVLGFCASSTYVSYASPTDVRIKAAAGVSSFFFW